MKKKFTIILCLSFCLFQSMNAFADVITIGYLKYSFQNNNATIIGYDSNSIPQNLVIPETVTYNGLNFSISTIGDNAFKGCSKIHSLTITKSLSIGKAAFALCNNLVNVNIVAHSIPPYAFQSCENLETVTLHKVVDIYNDAFSYCSKIRCIDLGNSLRRIGSAAFRQCKSLTYIVIPATISKICRDQYASGKYYTSFGDDSKYSYDADTYPLYQYTYDAFVECNYLQSVIWLNNNLASCLDGIHVWGFPEGIYYYPPWYFITWSTKDFSYTGSAPTPTYTYDLPTGFRPTNTSELPTLEKSVGTYTQNVPLTFANDDMSFEVSVKYTYAINPVTLKAKVNDASRLYGDADPQFSSSYTGFVNNEDERVITSHGSYQSTATKQSNVGTYTIKQSGATAQNYVFEYEDGTLTVNKAPLKMTANDKTMTYGSSLPTFDAKYDGLKNNETQPTWNVKPTFNTKASQSSRVGRYPITISNADAKNYKLTVYDGNLTVEKADLTVGVENKSRDYGDANPEFTLYYSGLRNNEKVPEWVQSPTVETKANRQSPVGTYTVSISNGSATNYNIKPIDGRLTINKAPLQVTPKNATRRYGEENPQFELSYLGLKNNESTPEWTTAPYITTNATMKSSVGNYDIQLKSAEARNYTLEKKTGTLTITKAPLTAVWVNNYTRKYGEANPKFELSYTGLVNNESAPLWTEVPVISTVATATSDVGEYAITAKGGEMRNYEIDKITPGVLTVTPAPLRVSAMNTSRLYFEDNPTLTYSCYGFVGNDNESVFINKPQLRTEAKKNSKVGVYPITISDASTKNYTLSYNPGELTIMKRELTVSTKDYTRAYGEENPEFELNYKGFVNNENEDVLLVKPKAMTVAKPDTDTGIYDITIGNGAAENYDFNYLGGKLTIEKAYQTLTWNQDLSVINQYDQVELLATASSGLDVTYTVEGAPICNVVRIGKKQYLDCFGEGEAVIIACQEGNKNFWQSTKSYKSIVIKSATGIIQANTEAGKSVKIYDAAGNRISKLQKGVNIIIMSDGTTKKVMVK